ncbi:LLM class flavin-dependent oxidoreductase [Blastococcus sp. URHD0036]|uniref:LLM class flavin-dependent oxidoreductase n=1 Tax=Blastococcus sp. URHD0036 TaxID=1380356 RepID=UPI000496CA5D|nr:LLM class flavin-dependent oxidoreductase [Blastococcus sp. URHD0036]
MYAIRFDLRTPDESRARDLYAAALDMAEWGERNGCVAVTLSEHHASPDGYLPSPLLVAAAMAARTTTLRFTVAALVATLHDPVRVAEDIAVLDRLSGGRVSHVLALGYRPEEYALFGVPWAGRGKLLDEKLDLLVAALRGEEIDRGGRRGTVTPNAPDLVATLAVGGGTEAAARRAGRLGLSLFAQNDDPALETAYQEAAAHHGHDPRPVLLSDPAVPNAVFVADDVDRAWAEIGPYLVHDATMYAAWNAGDTTTASLSRGATVDELRESEGSHRIVDVAGAVELIRANGYLSMHPMCGGIPPELAWPYLERVAAEVLPALG